MTRDFLLNIHLSETEDHTFTPTSRARSVELTILSVKPDSDAASMAFARRFATRIARMLQDMPTPTTVTVVEKVGAS